MQQLKGLSRVTASVEGMWVLTNVIFLFAGIRQYWRLFNLFHF